MFLLIITGNLEPFSVTPYLRAELDEPGPQTRRSCAPGSSAGLWAERPCRVAP